MKSGFARFDCQAIAICVLLLQSQKKSALDRFCRLGRRANAVRGSAHMRLRSRVTLTDLLQLWMQRKDSEISCARLSIVSIAGTNEIQRQPVLTIPAELFSRRSNNVAVSRRSFQLEIPAHLNALNNAADAYHFRGARSAVLPTCPITRIRRRCVDENIRSVSERPDKRAGQRRRYRANGLPQERSRILPKHDRPQGSMNAWIAPSLLFASTAAGAETNKECQRR